MRSESPWRTRIAGGVFALACIMCASAATADSARATSTPEIAIWYGDHQKFGQRGTPQRWLNVLGSIDPIETVERLTYRLDGGTERLLSIGPDDRRLAGSGDFNIEIPVNPLAAAASTAGRAHEIEIRAHTQTGEVHSSTMHFEYDPRAAWPLPYRIEWHKVTDVNDAVQVVDGNWVIQEKGLRTLEMGYDRAVAFGDARWGDFEMIAEVTLHGIDASGYAPPSNGPGFGFLTRWQGHIDRDEQQPKIGVWPAGTLVMYRWRRAWETPRLGMFGNGGVPLGFDQTGFRFEPGETYIVAIRPVTLQSGHTSCGLKIWPRDASEPDSWMLFITLEDTAPASGSILFIAHHADVTLGQVAVRKLNLERR